MALNIGPRLGFGAMRLSELEESAALRLVHEAFDRGICFFDTADVYAPTPEETGHNERLLAKALSERRDEVVVATKGGLRREGKKWIPDGRAKHLKAACEASLEALAVDCIDLYQLHVVDPRAPVTTSVRALASLREQGKIRHVGLCNVRLEDLEAAREIVEIESVQVELSPVEQTPLKNGVAQYCMDHGIRLIAHSPLGGRRRNRRIAKLPVLREIAKRHGVGPYEIALAWLRSLDPAVVPIPGATRVDSLVSSVHALEVTLTDEDVAELDEAFRAGAILRSAPRAVPVDTAREVVLFVGYPGAGKSTLAESWAARGYKRLNRDVQGGTLAALLPELDRLLASGERRVVLDNTYPRRESRFDVIETARRHEVPVRCLWLQTSLEQAQVNAVRRMVAKYGRLLQPHEMKSSKDPNDFGPDAQFRYRRMLEPPRPEEGFAAIEEVPFTPLEPPRSGRALILDELGAFDVVRRYVEDGYRIVQLTYEPGASEMVRRLEVEGIEIEVFACTHPRGPSVCWCRKPLPGLGVLAIEKFGLDPEACIVVGDSAVDRGFAERLGFQLVSPEEFYGGRARARKEA